MMLIISNGASAEIYRCKDAAGNTVFRDSPCPGVKIEATNEANKVWLQMKSLVEQSGDVHALMGPDVRSILDCDAKAAEFSKKLDEVELALQKLPAKTHRKMYLAMEDLRVCGTCRASAPTYCSKAMTNLKEETRVLVSYSGD